MKLIQRTAFGTSDKGNVFVLEFANQNSMCFEVRCGNHTILTTADGSRARAVASALVGPVEAETTSAAATVEAEPEPELAPRRRR